MRQIKRFLPYLGGVLLMLLLLRQIEPQELIGALTDADPLWLLLGCLFYLVTNVLRAWRFGLLLGIDGILPPLRLLPEMFALSFLNNVLPSRTGELSFPYFMYQRHGTSVGESTAILLAARIFDYAAVAFLFIIFALYTLPQLDAVSANIVLLIAILLGLTLGGLLVAPWIAQTLLAWAEWLMGRLGFANNALWRKVARFGSQAMATLNRLRSTRLYGYTFCWSLPVWLCTFGWFYAFLQAVNLPQPYPLVVMSATFASLAKAIPLISIGGFGAHEVGWAFGSGLTGVTLEQAVTSGFAVNILTLIISVIFGGGALLWMTLRGRARRRSNSAFGERSVVGGEVEERMEV